MTHTIITNPLQKSSSSRRRISSSMQRESGKQRGRGKIGGGKLPQPIQGVSPAHAGEKVGLHLATPLCLPRTRGKRGSTCAALVRVDVSPAHAGEKEPR